MSRPSGRSVAGALMLVGATWVWSCSSPEDVRFRGEVGQSLKEGAKLGSKLGVWAFTDEALVEAERQVDAAIADYRTTVEALPQPKDKRLRYLSIKLTLLGSAAEEVAAARVLSIGALNRAGNASVEDLDRVMGPHQARQAKADEAYAVALRELVAAERIGLGTNTVHDAVEASRLAENPENAKQSSAQLESLYAAAETKARSEIGRMR